MGAPNCVADARADSQADGWRGAPLVAKFCRSCAVVPCHSSCLDNSMHTYLMHELRLSTGCSTWSATPDATSSSRAAVSHLNLWDFLLAMSRATLSMNSLWASRSTPKALLRSLRRRLTLTVSMSASFKYARTAVSSSPSEGMCASRLRRAYCGLAVSSLPAAASCPVAPLAFFLLRPSTVASCTRAGRFREVSCSTAAAAGAI
mmetsp:Transcript_4786/g.19133  ORF Transcript_4786/g.19133 Transcript_4786/m.19133 type:complete len:204 (+) Transcript_4786:1764-2375(+)